MDAAYSVSLIDVNSRLPRHASSRALCNPPMKPVKEIRRNNLRRLLDQHGGPAQFARRMEKNDRGSTYSQIAGDNPTRNVGHNMAREIERKLGLEEGWMDVDHDGAEPAPIPLYATPPETRDVVLELLDQLIPQQRDAMSCEVRRYFFSLSSVLLLRDDLAFC